MGHIEKAPPLSVICTALKAEILFQDFVFNVDTLILQYALAISTKQTIRILNFYQTTKHTSDAAETSGENVHKMMPF